jgi:hypothetical protein
VRRCLSLLGVAVLAASSFGAIGADGAHLPGWFVALAHREAADLGDPHPRSITYKLAGASGTITMHGRFSCSIATCPFGLHGPAGSPTVVRGPVATFRIDTRRRRIVGFSLTYPILVVGTGTHSPARSEVAFSEAWQASPSAFGSLRLHQATQSSRPPITLTGPARRIVMAGFDGHNHVLLVAPTGDGGFCTSLSGAYGGTGCWLTPNRAHKGGTLEPGMVRDASGPVLLNGFFTFPAAVHLVVTYQGGSRETIPFAWVNGPIRAGFFVYDLSAHRKPGHRPEALTLVGQSGRRLIREQLPS